MDRRTRGVALLATALLATAIMGGVNRRIDTIEGTGSAAAADGPPVSEQCLMELTGPGMTYELQPDGINLTTSLLIGECGPERYGEVFVVQDSITLQQLKEDSLDLCPGLDAYIGLDSGVPGTSWQPALSLQVIAGRPNARQAAAGQRWAACVVMPAGAGPYTNPLKGSVSAGEAPPILGACAGGPQPRVWNDCIGTHKWEIFASKTLSEPPPAQAELDDECEFIVQRATAMPDIFAGGALSVHAFVIEVKAEFSPPTSTVSCVVGTTDNRKLIGSLRGLGDSPVPFQ